MAGAPQGGPAPAPTDHLERRHHPGAHVPEELRSALCLDGPRGDVCDGHAGAAHVGDHLPGERRRPVGRHRGDHAASGVRPDRSLSLEQPAQGGGVMPIARRVLRLLLYLILLSLSLSYLTPVYVMPVTSFKGMEGATLDPMWDLPSSFALAG